MNYIAFVLLCVLGAIIEKYVSSNYKYLFGYFIGYLGLALLSL